MRQTLLNFRSPNEITPEFRLTTVTYKGTNLNYEVKDQADPTKYSNVEIQTFKEDPQEAKSVKGNTKSNFGKEMRFREAPLFCQGSGQSVYTGPGSYNDHEKFIVNTKKPCSSLMKMSGHLSKDESKKQCYILIGQ